LNRRERFLRTMQYKDVDRVPDFEFGYWRETIDRWHREGLPLHLNSNAEIEDYFQLEGWDNIEMLPVRTGLWPPPPQRRLQDLGDSVVIDDGLGGIYVAKKWKSTPPLYKRYPLKSREDWERLRRFFDPDTPGRMPLNWNEVVKSLKDRDYPVGIFVGSLYGWLRNLMGVRGISIAFYKDPDWVAEMMNTLVELWITLIRRALRDVKVDFAAWWEDMCYNHGPLLGVDLFEEFMVPRYRRVTEVLKEYGVKVNVLDCDGKIDALVPGWLKAGINCMLPVEVRCSDPLKLREERSRKLLMIGGVNKFALIKGRKAVEEELERLKPLIEEGGYIPMVDHRVPPEVSLKSYVDYLKAKRKIIGRNEELAYPL